MSLNGGQCHELVVLNPGIRNWWQLALDKASPYRASWRVLIHVDVMR